MEWTEFLSQLPTTSDFKHLNSMLEGRKTNVQSSERANVRRCGYLADSWEEVGIESLMAAHQGVVRRHASLEVSASEQVVAMDLLLQRISTFICHGGSDISVWYVQRELEGVKP